MSPIENSLIVIVEKVCIFFTQKAKKYEDREELIHFFLLFNDNLGVDREENLSP